VVSFVMLALAKPAGTVFSPGEFCICMVRLAPLSIPLGIITLCKNIGG
jgi:hypothetical protein